MTLLESTIRTEDCSEKEQERINIIRIIHESEKGLFKPKRHEHDYIITENRGPIGPSIWLTCIKCKKSWDITDYDLW